VQYAVHVAPVSMLIAQPSLTIPSVPHGCAGMWPLWRLLQCLVMYGCVVYNSVLVCLARDLHLPQDLSLSAVICVVT